MKAREAFGAYATRPKELHGDWYLISFHARLIGMELIAQCADPGDLRIPVGKDWATTLCGKMGVSGPDRRNAKVAMSKLVEAGFLHIEDGFVRVTLDPVRSHSGLTTVPLRVHSGSTPDPKTTQVPENTNDEPLNKLVSKQESERDARAHSRESSARSERPPLPQPPPNLSPPPSEPIRPWARAWHIVERFTESEGQLGHPERHREWLEQLSAAATKDSGGHTHGPQFDNAVQAILVAWRTDDWVIKNQPPVSNIGWYLQKRAAAPKPKLAKVDLSKLSDEEFFKLAGAS